MRDKFMSGAHEKGCPKEDADLIWDMIEAGGSYILTNRTQRLMPSHRM